MRRLTERLGLLEHVLFTGFRRDLPDIYTAMDLYSQTSRREGLPITILEAMSVGLPIVATAASGVTSVLVDGENGLLAPVGDVKGVGDRITRLLKEPDLAQKLGATAKQQVETQYSLKTCMDAYYDLALSVLGMEQ
jgi:glycosyltransferase involved in cell wall biosynthesis